MVYGAEERRELNGLLDLHPEPLTAKSWRQSRSVLADVEVIMCSWGVPRMDAEFLASAPKLRAVFHAAGSIRPFTSDQFWNRGIIVSSAYAANALPVAEYTLATILLSLKNFWRFSAAAKTGDGWGDHTRQVSGCFRSTVGIVSLGMIARRVLELLKPFDLIPLIYCPFLSPGESDALGVERCMLEDVFRRSDVVSVHTPELPETRGMIDGYLLETMKPGATLINSARGAVINEPELIEVLQRRTDLTAVLDVTDPEPPLLNSPLLSLPNVVLTPHIAGSMNFECQRLGRYMVDELKRYLQDEPLRWQITKEAAARLA
jgi:phosphoglycerate dehydrogenase-like enzyme